MLDEQSHLSGEVGCDEPRPGIHPWQSGHCDPLSRLGISRKGEILLRI